MHFAKSKKLDPKVYTLCDYSCDIPPKAELQRQKMHQGLGGMEDREVADHKGKFLG